MKQGDFLIANGAALIVLGLVTGLIFDGWPEVIAMQAIALACAAVIYNVRNRER